MEKEVEDLLLVIGFIYKKDRKFGSTYIYKNYIYKDEIMVNPHNEIIFFEFFDDKINYLNNEFKSELRKIKINNIIGK